MSVFDSLSKPATPSTQGNVFPVLSPYAGRESEPSLLGNPERKIWSDAFGDMTRNPSSYLPYVNMLDILDSAKVYRASQAVQNGTATTEQNAYLNDFLAEQQRGGSIAYKAWSLVLRLPAYAIEFMTGGSFIKGGAKAVVRGGLKAGVKKTASELIELGAKSVSQQMGARAAIKFGLAAGKEGSETLGMRVAKFFAEDTAALAMKASKPWMASKATNVLGEEVTGRAILGAVEHAALQKTAFAAGGRQLQKAALEAFPRTLLMPHRVVNSTVQQMTPIFGLTQDEQGRLARVLADEGDDFLPAFAKAFGDTYIENLSEQTAESLVLLKGMFGPHAQKFLRGSFLYEAAEKVATKTGGTKAQAMKGFLSKHFLGGDERGIVQKLGFHSVLGEMGEEAVGGVLRQVTGISPLGLPEFDDVVAMAVGFAINPLALGGAARDGVAGVYAKRRLDIQEAIKEAKAEGADVGGSLREDSPAFDKVKASLRGIIDYYSKEATAEREGDLTMMDRFTRFMMWDAVERKSAELIGSEITPTLTKAEKKELGFEKVEFKQQVLEEIGRNMGEEALTDSFITHLTGVMMGVTFIDANGNLTEDNPSELARIKDLLISKENLPGQYDEKGRPRGNRKVGSQGIVNLFYLKEGAMDTEDGAYLAKKYPSLRRTSGADNFDPLVFGTVTSTNLLPDMTSEDVTDSKIYEWAQILGVNRSSSGDESIGGKRVGIVSFKNRKQMRVAVAKVAKHINDIAKNLPSGQEVVLSTAATIIDQPTSAALKNYPGIENAAKVNDAGEVMVNVGGAWLQQDNKMVFTPSGLFSDRVEEVLHSIIQPTGQAEGTYDEYVTQVADAIRSYEADTGDKDALKIGLAGKDAGEIFTKFAKIVALGNTLNPEGDTAAFIVNFGLNTEEAIKKLNIGGIERLSAYLEWKADQVGVNKKIFEEGTLGAKESQFKPGEKFETDEWVKTVNSAEMEEAIKGYEGVKKEGVDETSSPILDYDQERHGTKYEIGISSGADDAPLSMKQYLTDRYMANRGSVDKLGDKEWAFKMIDKHGKSIVPYLQKFFSDLESGAIKIGSLARKEAAEAKSTPSEKIPDEDTGQIPPKTASALPVAPLETASVPEAGSEEAPAESEATAPGESTEDVDEQPEAPAEESVVLATSTAPISTEAAESVSTLEAQQDSAKERKLKEQFNDQPNMLALIEKFHKATGKEITEVAGDAARSFSLQPETNSFGLADYDNMTEAEVFDHIFKVLADPDNESSDAEILQGLFAEDGAVMSLFNKVRRVSDIANPLLDGGRNDGNNLFYTEAKDKKLLSQEQKDVITLVEASIKVSEEDSSEEEAALGLTVMKSVRKFFESIQKVQYRYAMYEEGEAGVTFDQMYSSYGRNEVEGSDEVASGTDILAAYQEGNAITSGKSYEDIDEAWFFNQVDGTNAPGLLMASMGLDFLVAYSKRTGKDFYLLDGVKQKFSKKGWGDGTTAVGMSALDRRALQKDLYDRAVTDGTEEFDLLITRIGERGLTPVVKADILKGDALETAKKEYIKNYKTLSDVAKSVITNPDLIKDDYNWNLNIHRTEIVSELFGDLNSFKSNYDLMKRSHQVFTPGLRSNVEFKYIVFDDKNEFDEDGPQEFDGQMFYTKDTLGKAHFADFGRIFSNPKYLNFIKGFMVQNTANGNFVSVKPLLNNVDILQGKPYYDEIKKALDQLNENSDVPVTLVPLSSAKVLGLRGEDGSRELGVGGVFEGGKLVLDSNPPTHTSPAGGMYVTNSYDLPTEAHVKHFLKQVAGLNLLYEDADILKADEVMNDLFEEVNKRLAEDLSFREIFGEAEETNLNDDISGRSQAERLHRMGITIDEAANGPDGLKIGSILASAIAKVVSRKTNRFLGVMVAPGEEHDPEKTTRPYSGEGILPAVADVGIMKPDSEIYASWDNSDNKGRDRIAKDRAWYPFLFEMKDAQLTYDLKEKLVFEKDGRVYAPKDMAIISRIPASSVAFAVVTAITSRPDEAVASFIATDRESSEAKGEDFDADMGFRDGFFRKKNGEVILEGKTDAEKVMAFSNRATLLVMQGYLNASDAVFRASKEDPNIKAFDSIVDLTKNIPAPALLSEDGQTFWDNLVVSSGKALLPIAAAQSSVSRYLDYLNIGTVPNMEPVVVSKEHGLTFNRDRTLVAGLTQEQKLERDSNLLNTLINIYVDDFSNPRSKFLDHDTKTVPLLFALAMGNPTLSDKDDVLKFITDTTAWFRGPLIRDYKHIKEAKESFSHPDHTASEKWNVWKELKKRSRRNGEYSKADVDGLEYLTTLNTDSMIMKKYIDVMYGSSVGNIQKYVDLDAFDAILAAQGSTDSGLDFSSLTPTGRGAVISRSRMIVEVNGSKVYENDITLSPFASAITGQTFYQFAVEHSDTTTKFLIGDHNSRKPIFMDMVAIQAVADNVFNNSPMDIDSLYERINGRNAIKKINQKGIKGYNKIFKGNLFVDSVIRLKLSKNSPVKLGLRDELSRSALPDNASLQEYRDAFDELPPQAQDDYLMNQLLQYGNTSSHKGGGYMNFIGDKAYAEFHNIYTAEARTWLKNDKTSEQEDHAAVYLLKKLDTSKDTKEKKAKWTRYVPYDLIAHQEFNESNDYDSSNTPEAIEASVEPVTETKPPPGDMDSEGVDGTNMVIPKGKTVQGTAEVTDADRAEYPNYPDRYISDINQGLPAFSLTWDNAVNSEAWKEAERTEYTDFNKRSSVARYNRKWRRKFAYIRDHREQAAALADRYNLTDGLRSKLNTLINRNDRVPAVVPPAAIEQGVQEEFSYSLQPMEKWTEDMPQFFTTGQDFLHRKYMEVRNAMESEIIIGRIFADRQLRIAGGLKGLGYAFEKMPDNTYLVLDRDTPTPNGTYAFAEKAVGVDWNEAVAMQKARDKELRSEKKRSPEDVAKILSAATALRENPNETIYLHVTGEGDAKEDAIVEELLISEVEKLIPRAQLDQIVALFAEAMERRTVVNEMMSSLAGNEWIKEWGAMDENSGNANALHYAPHFSRVESGPDKIVLSKAQEDSKRSLRRKYPSCLAAYHSAEQKIPVTTDSARLTSMWFEDVWGAAVNRTMITLGANMLDVDAAPLWIPQFKLQYVDDKAYQVAMDKKQMFQTYDNIMAHVKYLASKKGAEAFIPKEDSIDVMVNQLVDGNIDLLKKDGYVPIQSNKFKSIGSWMVREGQPAENLLKMLENRPLEWKFFGGRNWAKGINKFNNWSKNMTLSMSLFHPFSLAESAIAIGGLTKKNWGALSHAPKTVREIMNLNKRIKSDPVLLKKWVNHGLRANPSNPNYDNNELYKDMEFLDKKFDEMGVSYLKKATGFWKGYNDRVNRLLWQSYLPSIKMWTAENVHTELVENFEERGIAYEDDQLLTDISKLVNDAFGGQNWDQYLWATPERKQLMHMMMFAPDWTLSAFNISGAGNLPALKEFIGQTDLQKDWQMSRYWPGMVVLVMTGIPQAVQLAIFAAAKVLPGPDDEDGSPFIFNNEHGKEGIGGISGHIDITPLAKKLGWEGAPTGKRRIYIRWAKQANEVFEGWGTRPLHTLMVKTSTSVRTVLEQMTGNNASGWTLGFKEKNLMTGLFSGEEGFSDSRIAYIGKKFVPMSILSMLEGRPTTFLAPASKGMSNFIAQKTMAQILTAYAEDDVWARIDKNKKWKTNLAALGPEVLDAAARNGLDPDMVLKAAKRHTLAHLYNGFFKALNSSNYDELERMAVSILRVNGTIKGLERSINIRAKGTGNPITDEQLGIVRGAFE